MPYPQTQPKVKHNLLKVETTSTTTPVAEVFTSTDEIFRKIDEAVHNASTMRIKQLSSVYSYDDGPDYPGPLSSGLLILGVTDRRLGIVKTVLGGGSGSGSGVVPDGVHRATLGVKLADKHHFHKLQPKDQHNSTNFGHFMQHLRKQNRVAIIARDKFKRFGLLVPMKKQQGSASGEDDDHDGGHLSREDCAAYIHVGTIDDVKKFMVANDIHDDNDGGVKDVAAAQSSNHQKRSSSSAGTTSSAIGTEKKKKKKKKRAKIGGTKWPIYRPDLGGFDDDEGDDDTTGWPYYQPDHGDYDDDDDDDDDSETDEDGDVGDANDSKLFQASKKNTDKTFASSENTNVWDSQDTSTSNDGNFWSSSTNNKDEDMNNQGHEERNVSSSSWGINDNDDAGGNFGIGDDSNNMSSVWGNTATTTIATTTNWGTTTSDNQQQFQNGQEDVDDGGDDSRFHKDRGAAAADDFYSNLTRDQDTTADSNLFHMRKFNNWVKSIQIQELDPNAGGTGKLGPKLRILDLACGKGGDLTKWMKLDRGMKFYFGVDVARGSLKDAAIRTRTFQDDGKLSHAIFAVADLGGDVLGQDQELLTWKMEDDNRRNEPEFRMIRGGGIDSSIRFDVVSIQFAIHYMMSTRERARHFFHTVSELLEVGGNLICTTIDARVVMKKLMGLGLDLHFKDGKDIDFDKAVVETGSGACKITFEPPIVKKIFTSTSTGRDLSEEMFGLEYTFTLVEGSDHAAGVGDAVNLPEWLTPIPVLEGLANEAGLELEYAQNFHEFYNKRKDVIEYQNLLRKMKALNRSGSISKDEWDISGLYAALKFRKVGESKISTNTKQCTRGERDEVKNKRPTELTIRDVRKSKNFPRAMLKAKRAAGDDWNGLSQAEKDALFFKEF
mmetsp:Transcript_14865/g.36412  ORF Transcript_14865/g.36412 Transcript_14865/m.36412 type:complete len:889 (+) Transcript_14865:224-2890(+)